MIDCDKCKYKKECRSLSDYKLTCEEVERIATDFYTKAKEAVNREKNGHDDNDTIQGITK